MIILYFRPDGRRLDGPAAYRQFRLGRYHQNVRHRTGWRWFFLETPGLFGYADGIEGRQSFQAV
jgi:hypothetical protein